MIDGYSPITGLSNGKYTEKPATPRRQGWALEQPRESEAEPKTTGEMFAEYFASNIRRNLNDIFREGNE